MVTGAALSPGVWFPALGFWTARCFQGIVTILARCPQHHNNDSRRRDPPPPPHPLESFSQLWRQELAAQRCGDLGHTSQRAEISHANGVDAYSSRGHFRFRSTGMKRLSWGCFGHCLPFCESARNGQGPGRQVRGRRGLLRCPQRRWHAEDRSLSPSGQLLALKKWAF